MSATLHVVIPVKGGSKAKSRLAPALSAIERQALALSMAEHVMKIALASPEVSSVTVVTACPRIGRQALALGARHFTDTQNAGTAAACVQATRLLGKQTPILFLNADLPFLTRGAVSRMVRCTDRIVIAPDLRRVGTNALLVPAGVSMQPCFGRNSFTRHVSAAIRACHPALVIHDERTASDIDEPCDLVKWGKWSEWISPAEFIC